MAAEEVPAGAAAAAAGAAPSAGGDPPPPPVLPPDGQASAVPAVHPLPPDEVPPLPVDDDAVAAAAPPRLPPDAHAAALSCSPPPPSDEVPLLPVGDDAAAPGISPLSHPDGHAAAVTGAPPPGPDEMLPPLVDNDDAAATTRPPLPLLDDLVAVPPDAPPPPPDEVPQSAVVGDDGGGAGITTFCPICLDDVPTTAVVGVARCAHRTCRPCLSRFWSEAILDRSVPFPRCVAPGCGAYASDADVAGVVGDVATRRLRHLRSLRPHRAADGRRLHCAADGCWEALPPPPPGAADPVSACPRCGAATCGRCGAGWHPGRGCGRPLVCARQERLYAAWAVGRVGVCAYCGVHVERRGGCTSVRCRMCRRTFAFRPFGSAGEAAAAAVVPAGEGAGAAGEAGDGRAAGDRRSGPGRVVAALAGVDEGGPPSWGRLARTLGLCGVLATWGAAMAGLPLWLVWGDEGELDWEVLPLAGVGFGMLLLSWAAVVTAVTREAAAAASSVPVSCRGHPSVPTRLPSVTTRRSSGTSWQAFVGDDAPPVPSVTTRHTRVTSWRRAVAALRPPGTLRGARR